MTARTSLALSPALLLGLLLSCPALVRGQVEARTVQLPVEWITVDDGLPQGMVRAIVQDRSGYMWFGTKDGLVRSDGYDFTVYRHDARDSTSLCGNHITFLLEDREGMLWVATENDGIARFDPRTGRFLHVHPEASGAGERALAVRAMCEDADGNIWTLAQRGQVAVITKGNTGGATDPAPAFGDVEQLFPGLMRCEPVLHLAFSPVGDLWALRTSGLTVFSRSPTDRSAAVVFPIALSESNYARADATERIVMDPARQRVLLLCDTSIMSFDAATRQPLDTLHLSLDGDVGGHMMVDSRSRLWTAYDRDHGVARIDLVTGRTDVLRFEPLGRSGFPELPLAISWCEDRTGNIWVGTGGYGVLKYRITTERFQRYLPATSRFLVQADPEGRHLLAREGQEWLDPPDGRIRMPDIGQALRERGQGPVWGAYVVDPQEHWWCCAEAPLGADPVLTWYDPGTSKALHAVTLGPGEHPVEVFPAGGDEMWITAYSEGYHLVDRLLRFNTRTMRVTGRFLLPQKIQIKEYRAISSLVFAQEGALWMGTPQGVLVLQPATGRWRQFKHDPKSSASIPSDMVLTVCLDPDDPTDRIWIGTEGAGMVRMDMGSGQCDEHYSTHNGLPNDVIYGILSDGHRNLWVSTNQGLSRLDPRTGKVRTFTTDDGIAGNEFNRYGSARSHDGRLFFSGIQGVTAFNPEDLYTQDAASPTVITALRLGNKAITPGVSTLPGHTAPLLPLHTGYTRTLTLPFDQSMIAFSFACMDHTAPKKNRYRYKLEGFNKDWIEAGAAHEATFTNLDPGHYTFHVQGRNSAGVLDEKGASIALIITPPWWGTWWFRIAAVLAAGAVIYGFYRYRLAQAIKVVRVRERIARDLHDEIGSTLSSVALYSAVAQRKTHGHLPEAHELLGRITESTTSVLEAMNDIVWAVNAENDDLAHVVARMNSHAERMTDARECALRFDVQEGIATQHLGMSQRKNLYLIFKEAVNNAVKYSGCKSLRIELRKEGADYLLRIQDDGVGFDVNARRDDNMGGNGLGNMRRRAGEMGGTLEIVSAPGQGTAVHLLFTTEPGRISVDHMTSPTDARR
jgi:ligand-binding sensor domain-containing protein/two-component sensor histidine kinase